MASSIFPISIIAQQWLSVTKDDDNVRCNVHDDGNHHSIGISPDFRHGTAPIFSETDQADHTEVETLQKELWYLERDESKFIALDKNTASYRRHKTKLSQAEQNLEQAKTRLSSKTDTIKLVCAFQSSKGLIALPITFEEAANMAAMAQQGRIVEVSMDTSTYETTITARWPSLRDKKAVISLTGLRPASRLRK